MIRNFTKILKKRLSEEYPLIQVVLGPRQVGKTYGVKQVYEEWEGSKIYETADLVSPPNEDWILEHWKRAENNTKAPSLLILDEIQKIPNWSEAVKFLFDKIRGKKDLRVVLLGSASMSIQEGLSESLAGRFELTKVYHWDFVETLEFAKLDLEKYLLFGGYPESYKYIKDLDRWQDFLQLSIIDPVITRDIQGIRRINKPALFRQTLELVLKNPAQEISLQKILGQLQDKGNVTTIAHYLNLFEGAFLIKQLQKYSKNTLRQKASSPKIIPLCPALSNAFLGLDSFPNLEMYGHIFEASVGAKLATLRGKLSYWREGDYELDFVYENKQKTFGIEVKSGLRKKSSSLGKFLKKYPDVKPIAINQDNIIEFFNKGEEFFS